MKAPTQRLLDALWFACARRRVTVQDLSTRYGLTCVGANHRLRSAESLGYLVELGRIRGKRRGQPAAVFGLTDAGRALLRDLLPTDGRHASEAAVSA